MNKTSPSSRLVKSPARSAAFSMVGPLVLLIFAPMALAMMLAIVVLPRPGGPLSRTWSMGSPRCLAAVTVISRRSLTLACPVKSEKREGRRVISSAASGLVSTLEIGRSGIDAKMGKHPGADKGKSCHLGTVTLKSGLIYALTEAGGETTLTALLYPCLPK